jgi:hypothetical protein
MTAGRSEAVPICSILFRNIEKPQGWSHVRLTIDIQYANASVASVVTSLSPEEIRDLAGYFAKHVRSLSSSAAQAKSIFAGGTDSPPWFTPLYDFKLQAFAGSKGARGALFSVSMMLSIAHPGERRPAIWLGCEIAVTDREATEFVERLNNLATQIESEGQIMPSEIRVDAH